MGGRKKKKKKKKRGGGGGKRREVLHRILCNSPASGCSVTRQDSTRIQLRGNWAGRKKKKGEKKKFRRPYLLFPRLVHLLDGRHSGKEKEWGRRRKKKKKKKTPLAVPIGFDPT